MATQIFEYTFTSSSHSLTEETGGIRKTKNYSLRRVRTKNSNAKRLGHGAAFGLDNGLKKGATIEREVETCFKFVNEKFEVKNLLR